MNPLRGRWIALAALTGLIGCGVAAGAETWLSCQDCGGSIGGAPISAGDVPFLGDALRRGPKGSAVRHIEKQAGQDYTVAKRYQTEHPGKGAGPLPDSLAFVYVMFQNYIASYQKRAGWALRELNSPVSRHVLDSLTIAGRTGAFGWRSDVGALTLALNRADPVTGVSIVSLRTSMARGSSFPFAARVSGVGQVSQAVVWSSSDLTAAVVSATGTVTVMAAAALVPVAVRACSTAQPPVICGQAMITVTP